MKDFFISYTRVDRAWAEWIAWHLEAAGYTTILDVWDFRPGGNFVLAMQEAAATAICTLAVLSPDYLAALYTQPEWAAAFAQDPSGTQRRLLPVRVRACALRGLLRPLVAIDLVELDEERAGAALLSGVGRERTKPPTPPRFPGGAPHAVGEAPGFPGRGSQSARSSRLPS
jgi:hypothetical protein